MHNLTQAIQRHPSLTTFHWMATLRFRATPLLPHNHRFDPVVEALATCPRLDNVRLTHFVNEFLDVSEEAVQALHHIQRLHIQTTHWHAVAACLRLPECRIANLTIQQRSASIFDCRAMANALKANFTLQNVIILSQTGFTDEAGVLLARTLRHNMGLKSMQLGVRSLGTDTSRGNGEQEEEPRITPPVAGQQHFSVEAYKEFYEMLKLNGFCRLDLEQLSALQPPPSLPLVKTVCAQIRIQSRLNHVGLARLLHSEAAKPAWIHALTQLNRSLVEVEEQDGEDHHLQLACLYTVLRSNPLVCE